MGKIKKYYQNGIEYTFEESGQVVVNTKNIESLISNLNTIKDGAYISNGYITPIKIAAAGTRGESKVIAYDETTQNFKWLAISDIEDLTTFKVDGSRSLLGDLNLGGNQLISTTVVDESLGPELLEDPTFDISNSWARVNAVISGGVATLTVTNGSGANIIEGDFTYEVGETYEVAADITGSGTGKVAFQDNTGNSGGLLNGDTLTDLTGDLQRLTFRFVANSNSNVLMITRGVNSGNYTITVDNATLKKVNLASTNNEIIEVPNGLSIGGVRVPTKTIGTTAERPSTPVIGDEHFDTTLGYRIDFNGTDWVDGAGTIR